MRLIILQVFADHLAGLTVDHVTTACRALLPVAGRLTPGRLTVRLRRMIAAIDPRHYKRQIIAHLIAHGRPTTRASNAATRSGPSPCCPRLPSSAAGPTIAGTTSRH